MKKALKIIGIVIAVIAFLVLVPPLFMPSTYKATASITIQSDPYNIFQHFADLRKWEKWSPWKEKDPATAYTYSENTFGAGSYMSWASNNQELGTGKITTVQFKKFHHINYELHMIKPYAMKSSGEFVVEKLNENESKVTWTNKGKLAYPFERWMNGIMSFGAMVEKDFKHGLENFKKTVESDPKVQLPILKPITMELEDIVIFSVMHETLRNSDISAQMAEDYKTINNTINRTGAIAKEEPPLCLIYNHNRLTTRFRPGIAVQGCLPMKGDVECISLRKGRVLRITYYGGYHSMETTYDAIEIYLEDNKIKKRENYTWEQYISDPGVEPDSTKWLTYIYVPVK